MEKHWLEFIITKPKLRLGYFYYIPTIKPNEIEEGTVFLCWGRTAQTDLEPGSYYRTPLGLIHET